MFLIVSKYLIPKGYRGMALFPFVIIKNLYDKQNKIFLNHEKIHIRQQLELLIVPFFVMYFSEYLVRLLQYRNKNEAYRNISFEREAYGNERNLEYLSKRKLWSSFSYLKSSEAPANS